VPLLTMVIQAYIATLPDLVRPLLNQINLNEVRARLLCCMLYCNVLTAL
jgi:hypothetical protein